MATTPTSITPTASVSASSASPVAPAPPSPTVAAPSSQSKDSSIPLYNLGDKVKGVEKQVGSVDRQQLRDAALGVAVSPGLGRKIAKAKEASKEAAGTGAAARQSATTMIAIASQLPGMPEEVLSFAARLQQQVAKNQQGSARRQKEATKLTARIKRTFFLIIGAAFFFAIVADILSIWDLGWLISWIIPIFTFFIYLRIQRINRGAKGIMEAIKGANREIEILQQRLRPQLTARQRVDLLRRAVVDMVFQFTSSYFMKFMLWTFGVQIAELIPGIDWLPMYIGGVLKITVDQYNAYTKARRLIPKLQQAVATIERLEAFELEQQTQQLTFLVQYFQQQLIAEQQLAYRAIESRTPKEVLRDIQRVTEPEPTESPQKHAKTPPRRDLRDIQPAPQLSPAPAL